jgi:hypothetical protein
LWEKLVKISVNIIRNGRQIMFQLSEVAIPRSLCVNTLRLIDDL